jgi:hypothetical protein
MATTMSGHNSQDLLESNGGMAMEAGAPNAEGFIYDPRDTDVLCGRGGAALRHPGNQTYRHLVNLNKGLYITCLKTEKLKISRSIVAAIREQNGRFLEKDSKKNAWFDIGDKKAIEKTSQALREGQPKLRQKIAEMGAVPVNQYELELASGDYDAESYEQQQYALQQQELMPPPMQSQIQQQQLLRQQELLQQQSYENLLLDSSSHSNLNNHSSSNGLRRQQEMQAMQPPSPLSPTASTANHAQDLHAEMLHRLSLHDLQTVAAATGDMNHHQPTSHQQRTISNGSATSLFQQQQMNHHHQQLNQQQQQLNQQQQQMNQQQHMNQQRQQLHNEQRNRLRPSLNTRASLARELGIAESQLSLMSEFSAFGGSISTSGLGSVALANAGNTMMANSAEGLANSFNDIQGMMSVDSSFKRALMGLPVGSLHTLQASDHLSLDNASMSTASSTNHSMRFGGSSAMAAAAAAAAVNNTNNFDRRRVFAKMKYSRPPSARSPKAAPFGSLTGVSQHGVQSQYNLEELPDFHLLESNMSMYSNLSNLTGLDSRTANSAAAVAAAAAAVVDTSTFNNVLHSTASFHMPSNFNSMATGSTKVIVETAKVIDHSSNSRSNLFSDVMSGGSRHSIMSGLSRISDTSIDHSIFSDLSRKIGNVSTRSMAMSEISAIELQERDNEDESSSNDGIGEPISSFEQQLRGQQHEMDFEL